MRKFSILIMTAVFIIACSSTFSVVNTQMPPTEIPATPTLPTDGFPINGQLQGTLAFIRNNNLWINVNGVENQITSDADPSTTGLPARWYSNPKISPDGTKIAYLKNADTDARSLMVHDMNGGSTTQLANDMAWVPPTTEWSNDGRKIYYPVSNGLDTTTGLETITVKSVTTATGELQEYGQYGVRTGCGGGSSDPADHISSDENLHNPTGGGYVFDLSPQNTYIIHATTCSNAGLGLLDLSTKQDRILDENVMGAIVSPDGSKIAAVSVNGIVLFNVNTGGIESTLPTAEAPMALLWTADDRELLYSTSTLSNTLTLDDNTAMDLFGSAPVSYRLNTSSLWMISLESGQSQKILEIEAHNLKPMVVNNQKALVVMVENASKLFDYISQGNKDNLADYYPTSNIIEVDLANSSFNTVTNNTKQASYFK